MPKASKPRVVIDTNLIVSAVISSGGTTPHRLLKLWRDNRYVLLTSGKLLNEVNDVLTRDYIKEEYSLSQKEIAEIVASLILNGIMVETPSEADLPIHSRDPKDDRLLALALGGQADYLVTGDNDLLDLNGKPELGKLKIITAAEFLTILTSESK